jgi:MFS family permease
VVLILGAVAMLVFMRPDPLLTAQIRSGAQHQPAGHKRRNMRVTLLALRDSPMARLAFVTVVLGHTVMAAVMTMTPVHMMEHGASLTLVGMTISVHVLGMYAFSPVVGWLSDRYGRIPTIGVGQALLILAAIVAGLSGSSTAIVTVGLLLLGLGWSFALVAGSTLLAESVAEGIRPTVQGTSDMAMNMLAAVAAGASGWIQGAAGFSGLNVVAGVMTIPVLAMIALVRRGQRAVASTSVPGH